MKKIKNVAIGILVILVCYLGFNSYKGWQETQEISKNEQKNLSGYYKQVVAALKLESKYLEDHFVNTDNMKFHENAIILASNASALTMARAEELSASGLVAYDINFPHLETLTFELNAKMIQIATNETNLDGLVAFNDELKQIIVKLEKYNPDDEKSALELSKLKIDSHLEN